MKSPTTPTSNSPGGPSDKSPAALQFGGAPTSPSPCSGGWTPLSEPCCGQQSFDAFSCPVACPVQCGPRCVGRWLRFLARPPLPAPKVLAETNSATRRGSCRPAPGTTRPIADVFSIGATRSKASIHLLTCLLRWMPLRTALRSGSKSPIRIWLDTPAILTEYFAAHGVNPV